ncbi:hypothetical protein [Amycolatopsis eburnea]|uniref:Uncharacterized protein n=1 Tax=Amycolatopsis eburnea TaxID=2267691 RepID=A0A427TJI3_9PSEU|nr:hypothetical protein [Amycolatopsis eburnea]RSD23944.1 hypothetical protein EIY87_06125 [Amycolatopsis eburnea]
MTTTAFTPAHEDPSWVLEQLIVYLIAKHQEAITEFAKGNRLLSDRDRISGYEEVLVYLNGLTVGRMGLGSEELAAVWVDVEVQR